MRKIRIAGIAIMVVSLAAVLGAVGFARTFARNAEYDYFQRTFGSARNSEHAEEWLLRDFFKDRRNGVFVDVGSYDYQRFSNTYYLEHVLEWSGIAIDAQEEFAAGYAKHRPRTRFFSFFVSDRSDALESLFVPAHNQLVASSRKDFSDRYDASGRRKVRTITLNDLLERAKITSIDFLTMDIELAEPKALAGFDIERYRPLLVCVEAHPRSGRSCSITSAAIAIGSSVVTCEPIPRICGFPQVTSPSRKGSRFLTHTR